MENQIKHIEEMLEKLDFVQWDRFVNPTDGEYHLYGWITRDEDTYKDFVVLSNVDERWWYISSSDRFSKRICEIVDGTEDSHVECQRVEDNFIIKNAVKLQK